MSEWTTIKPGEFKTLSRMNDIRNGYSFEVENDNGILVLFYADSGGTITVAGGDSVFAGGDKDFNISSSELKVLYLESGRFAKKVDGKNVIHISSTGNGINCVAFQLI